MNSRFILLLCFAFFHPGMSVQGRQLFADSISYQIHIPSVPEGLTMYRLDNGLEILLIENRALPMVGINVQVKIGSAYETYATSGMSHMLEHLLFNGTTTRTQKQLYDDVDQIGGYNNANTSMYYTNYMMVTPAEYIRQGIEIQSDMLFNSILPSEKFEKEKGIVLEEIARSISEPESQVERNKYAILFNGHALSLPTLGTYATIEGLSRQDVVEFYTNAYVPNNMVLSVIGNFKSDSMLSWIEQTYGSAKPGQTVFASNPNWNTGFSAVDDVRDQNRFYHRYYKGDKTILQLFIELPNQFEDEFYELLEKSVAQVKDDLKMRLSDFDKDGVKNVKIEIIHTPVKSFFQTSVILTNDLYVQKIANETLDFLSGLTHSLDDEYIISIIAESKSGFLKNLEKPHMFGIYNAELLAIDGIDAVISLFSGDKYKIAAKNLENFTLSGTPIAILHHPNKSAAHQAKSESLNTKLFTDESGNILIARQNPNGNILAIHYLVKHKAKFESIYGKDAAKILHDCIKQRLESDVNKKVSMKFGLSYKVNDNPYIPMDNVYMHPDFGYIRAEGLADDIPGAISFINSQLNNFTPTYEEVEKAIDKFRNEVYSIGGNSARELFDQTVKSLIYEPILYPEGNDDFTIEQLISFAEEYFHPGNMIISIVSPENPDRINDYFSTFVKTEHATRINDDAAYSQAYIIPEESIIVNLKGGGEQSYLLWGFIHTIIESDKPALKALSLILADRINFDIREKQGLAYRMKSGIDINRDKALFYIRLGTRPQNIDTIIDQAPGLLGLKTVESLTEEELEKSINMYIGRMMFRRLSSINQGYHLGRSLYFYDDIEYDEKFIEQIKRVSVNDVMKIANKYLNTDTIISITVK